MAPFTGLLCTAISAIACLSSAASALPAATAITTTASPANDTVVHPAQRRSLPPSGVCFSSRDTDGQHQEPRDQNCWTDLWGYNLDPGVIVIHFGRADTKLDPKHVNIAGAALPHGSTFYLDCEQEWNFFPVSEIVTGGLEIHPGNTCFSKLRRAEFDNTWIRFKRSGLFMNLPTDKRCHRTGHRKKSMRCIIPISDFDP
ncbi:hypothetical protein PG993_003971 [Apiospora rasikravindrae]|uniref:Uncharacterized protein n=1 Tax=Apiospora rasikravindrae TaxID=990691 RepID=A0ABR1U107_9PEZI